MENCIFCDALKNGDSVFETENFFIKLGKGIVCTGHCMIITKKHYKCMGDMDTDIVSEYLDLKTKLISFLSKHFYKPFVEEHGVIMQSVFHAHTHFIPRKSKYYDELNLLEKMILEPTNNIGVELEKISNFDGVIECFKQEGEYLYFEQDEECFLLRTKKYTNLIDKIKDDINYRFFFSNLGIKGVRDWKTMTEDDLKLDKIRIEETADVFRKFGKDLLSK
ncbi:MAG: HIT family protein [Rickettsiales bacterium]|jgi:diadenosine tetraphosphate (Ap4A) HIT family hydrolase|nr:HIT family protein [Rickettsiales bacterium]